MAIDPIFQQIDVRDGYALTRMLEIRKAENQFYNVAFAPLKQHRSRKVRLFVKRYNGSGMSDFRSVNANTPIMPNQGNVQEIKLDLVNLAELAVLDESDVLALGSPDQERMYTGLETILETGERLKMRNINRSIWMAWQAAKDSLVITYPDGGAITVTWDLAGAAANSWFTSSHVVTPTTDWNHQDADGDYDATIIDDIETWADILAIDGNVTEAEIKMHINTRTWRIIQENKWLRNQFSTDTPRDIRPRKSEAAEALGIGEIVIVDDAYYSESTGARTKYLLDGEAIITGPYTAKDGNPIAEMLDGPVVKAVNGQLVVESNPGMQAEMWVKEEPPQQFIRLQSARMPVLNHPESFIYATLWS